MEKTKSNVSLNELVSEIEDLYKSGKIEEVKIIPGGNGFYKALSTELEGKKIPYIKSQLPVCGGSYDVDFNEINLVI